MAAKAELAARLYVAETDIVLVSVQEMEWTDSSLGCPQPGQLYLQVITPGYRLVLRAGGNEHIYHTDTRGRVVLCQLPGA